MIELKRDELTFSFAGDVVAKVTQGAAGSTSHSKMTLCEFLPESG